MAATTSQHTIEALRSVFARFGLPEQLASDNGPQFTSDEFARFMKQNGIKHILSAPYHPSSNGLAERFVQTFKKAMRAGEKDGLSLSNRLSKFLFAYRSTPHATTDSTPSDLFLQRQLRTRFDLLKADSRGLVESRQRYQKKQHDNHTRLRNFVIGSPVMVRDYRHADKWVPGTVVKKLGPVTYRVDIGNGNIVKRHVDQLTQRQDTRSAIPPGNSNGSPLEDDFPYPTTEDPPRPDPDVGGHQPLQRRYPPRIRQPPNRLMVIHV